MNILVIGTAEQASECFLKFGEAHAWHTSRSVAEAAVTMARVEVIFDFVSPDEPAQLRHYSPTTAAAVFLDTSCAQLSGLTKHLSLDSKMVFGFCGLPSLLNRELLEVSLLNEENRSLLESVCAQLNTSFEIVGDHAGMVSPRVICMIINEAFYTLEEGTATREDIDLAMKLGTNYPFGPFEWSQRIGLSNVVKVLQAALAEAGDERYRVCPMLRAESGLA